MNRHYEVSSPTIERYSQFGPPEPFGCWALVEAPTAKAAIAAAVKLPEFDQWVREARGDGVPPFKGVRARRAVCEHGNCWACVDCAECLARYGGLDDLGRVAT